MVEILDVGTEVVTRFMPKDLNGLHGTIVSYNTSNARYTLELDNGEMMSLRARNVVATDPNLARNVNNTSENLNSFEKIVVNLIVSAYNFFTNFNQMIISEFFGGAY